MDLLGALGGIVQRAPAKDAEAPERRTADDGASKDDHFDKAMKSAESERSEKPEEAPRPSRKKERAREEGGERDASRFLNTDDTLEAAAQALVAPIVEAAPAATAPAATLPEAEAGLPVEGAETPAPVHAKAPPQVIIPPTEAVDTVQIPAEANEAQASPEAVVQADAAVDETLVEPETDPKAVVAEEQPQAIETAVATDTEAKKKTAASAERPPLAIVVPKVKEEERPAGPRASLAETRPLEAQRAEPKPEVKPQDSVASAPQTADPPPAPQAAGEKPSAPAPLGALQAQPASAQPQAPHSVPLHAHAPALVASAAPPEAAQQVVAAIRSNSGGDKIEVRLDPPELGRVRIHFSMERNDTVVATVSTDRSDTLDLMRRNASDLVKELERAGFANVQLDFSARGDASYSDAGAAGDGGTDPGLAEEELADNTTFIYARPQIEGRLDRLV